MSTALVFDNTEPEEITEISSKPTTSIAAWFDDALLHSFGYFITRIGGRVAVDEDRDVMTVTGYGTPELSSIAKELLDWNDRIVILEPLVPTHITEPDP